MSADEIRRRLFTSRVSIENDAVSESQGVYALFLRSEHELPLIMVSADRLLYVGKADSLRERLVKRHFKSGRTGSSTVRRTFGALLKERLGLQVIPRGRGKTDKDCQNYCFSSAGEEKLTQWMLGSLEVGICPVSSDHKSMEKVLIGLMQPPLCLNSWENPHISKIEGLRKLCADDARARLKQERR
jgi:hypothetical protein